MKTLVIAGVHGNEQFGLKILGKLQQLQCTNVELHVAHPEAIAKHVRYVMHDLNRSFGDEKINSVEYGIARTLSQKIRAENYNLVIDLHTSTVAVGYVAVLASAAPALSTIAKFLDVEHIAIMPNDIAQQALIGVCPEVSICLEFGQYLRSDKLALEVAQSIQRLTVGNLFQDPTRSVDVYHIDRVITRDEATGLSLRNYEYEECLSGYPFLTGTDNYLEHRGFLATYRTKV